MLRASYAGRAYLDRRVTDPIQAVIGELRTHHEIGDRRNLRHELAARPGTPTFEHGPRKPRGWQRQGRRHRPVRRGDQRGHEEGLVCPVILSGPRGANDPAYDREVPTVLRVPGDARLCSGSMPTHLLARKTPLAELHCHLGGAVTPAIMWGIAHAQGIKLPTKDYWEFRELITVSPRRARSFDGYLQLFHWTELIQSSPLAVERSVYEVVGGAYRKNNVTTMELRFNPMKRNRGGEQDLDHIIAAAVRGMDKAVLEYPIKPGLIFCLDRAFPYELNEIIAEKAITWRDRGVVGIDIAGPESATFRVADYRRLFRRARQFGLGITVHTGESGPVEEVARVVELLEPDRIGHGVKAAYDPRAMEMIRERGIVLEICPTSNLNTRVVSGWDEFRWIFDQFRRNEVRFTINTDGPEMLKTYIRDELAQLGRLGILSVEDQQLVAATALQSSFVPNVSDVALPKRAPAPRDVVEREEA